MGKQIVLPYSEIRIANAFKPGVELTTGDIAELHYRCVGDNNEWKRRKNKRENVGELVANIPRRSQRKKMIAWFSPITDSAGIWGK